MVVDGNREREIVRKLNEVITALNTHVLYDAAPDCQECIVLLSEELKGRKK